MSKPSTLVNSPSAEFQESPHDIEMQSPARANFHDDEKLPIGLFPSTPSDRTEVDAYPSEEPQRPRPVRKYSGEWWKRYWTRAIIIGHLPRILYGMIGLVIVALWIGMSFYFAQNEIAWNKDQQIKFTDHMSNTGKNESAIALEGALKNFDPTARSLNVEWSGLWKDYGVDMEPVPLTNGTRPNTAWPFEIYRDTATTLWLAGEGNPYYDPNSILYKIANGSTPAIAVIGWTIDDSFNTEISFKQASDNTDIFRQPLFAYPYDEWKGAISFTINDPWQDVEQRANKSSVFAPSGARLTDHTLNWRFDLNVTKDCPYITDAVLTQYFGMTLNDDFDNSTLAFGTVPCQLRVEMIGRRPPMVKFAAILSLLVNWTSTFFIFILTCEVLIMRRGFMLAGTDLFGVTFTSLFALPSVRLLLPGAPDFGALIDLIGIIPNVIIISICIIAIAVTKLNKNKYQGKEA